MKLEDEHSVLESDDASSTESESPRKPASFFLERPPQVMEVAPQLLRHWTRRDVLLFGMGAIAAVAGGGSLLPQTTLERDSALQSYSRTRAHRYRLAML
jgi:hypothetical protein